MQVSALLSSISFLADFERKNSPGEVVSVQRSLLAFNQFQAAHTKQNKSLQKSIFFMNQITF